ncbi:MULTISPECIES: hypothetical protein [unclassified Lysobacter]|uniref:hypothetical protein n=1 Tax=unclassified Lysobacter TaxID=2635362 RepID=UPI001BE56756|nr:MULTISPECIES: hypothetical protein [unclassified Lysobacter]MBT2749339.1 hypothetical protein [Lysobacter sp. ISL-42]MBT2750886.1 hypothetical protein [Lysobacter sp. ISL-50]MBT2777953.1 hypothetical protein [Lysobacter sp. ISL-54]MBT2783989.1 hypothetical protein [Lysobacter sp. ISL-52]
MSQTDPRPTANAEDASHLQILSIAYYVFVVLDLLSIGFIALYAVMMSTLFSMEQTSHASSAPPQAFVHMIVGFCVFAALLSLLFAALHFVTARRLRDRRGLGFCQVVAGLTCLSIPLGTTLGVFTFIVLGRPSVKALFQARS